MAYEFNHVHLKSPDPEKTANWYVKAFNFKIISDTVRPVGDRFVRCETSDGIVVNISSARTDEQMGNGDATAHYGLEHFGINVDDMDAEIKRLEGLGAELVDGPMDGTNGLRIAF
ncbi:MAG: VOC family protein, partial [Chloroflexi bacterium]|nr:VOC family protein [Chloroflexota bacterium]